MLKTVFKNRPHPFNEPNIGHFRGLLAATASSVLCEINWKHSVGKDVNGLMYAHMITPIAVLEVQQLYKTMSVCRTTLAQSTELRSICLHSVHSFQNSQ